MIPYDFSIILNVILSNYQGVIQKIRVVVVNLDQLDYTGICIANLYNIYVYFHEGIYRRNSHMKELL